MSDFKPQNARYARLVDRYSRHIQSPVQRLKFLNTAMKADPPRGSLLSRIPFAGSLSERAKLIVELSKYLPRDEPAPAALRVTSLLYRVRLAVYAVSFILALTLGAGLVYTVMKAVNGLSLATQARSSVAPAAESGEFAAAEAVSTIGSQAGLGLDKVWLAESGSGYEFYSNGARVLTEYEVTGSERSFYRFGLDATSSEAEEPEKMPVGIVYHLSEGDLLPFAGHYNTSLQTRSKGLLEYSRQNRLYNYVIDRFGRTYRIVRDEFVSNHAGNSVWSDGRSVFVSLNQSFIGICFEGKSLPGKPVGPDGINEAQVYAARVLTAVLRSKYSIEDANCVTHGLVSVNPSNRLVGYHTDWVSGFPFEAIGLSNKYESTLVAISRFGFSYDQAYVEAAGGRKWAGLERAEFALKESAKALGAAEEEHKRTLFKDFQRLYSRQADRPTAGE